MKTRSFTFRAKSSFQYQPDSITIACQRLLKKKQKTFFNLKQKIVKFEKDFFDDTSVQSTTLKS